MGPDPSAGPFIVSTLDRTAQRIVLTRNPKWWGTPALLDSITYLVLDDAARIPALQNNTIDATGTGHPRRADHRAAYRRSLDSACARKQLVSLHVQRCTRLDPGRQGAAAGDRQGHRPPNDRQRHPAWARGQSRPAEQPRLRRRAGGLPGQQRRGRLRPGEGQAGTGRAGLATQRAVPREGRPPARRSAMCCTTRSPPVSSARSRRTTSPRSESSWTSTPRAAAGFFSNHINVGDFDIAQFSWVGDAFPLSGLPQIYASDGESNFGKIGSPEIDAKIEQTLEELDPAKARDLANEVDKLIWAEGVQPAADAIARKRRGAKHFGELRRVRPRRRGLHQDRLHEAVTRCTVRGTAAGNACSTAAAAAMPQISSRTPRPPGVESSFLARAGRPELAPS